MIRPVIRSVLICWFAFLFMPGSGLAQSCAGSPVAVQILGSGGPRANPDRASASYLLWIGSEAKMMVDAGGGAYLRLGQSGAKFADVSLFAISHLHPDHTSDLPAILWSNQTGEGRSDDPLPIIGPSGNQTAPDFQVFLNRLFDAKDGAFRVLGATLGGVAPNGRGVRLKPTVVDVTKTEPTPVFDRAGIAVTAIGIPHGDLPTLAYRVKTRDVSVVFSSDQTGTNPKFTEFAKGANALVMHLTVGAGVVNPLHAAPDVVGRVARDAGVGRLIVSHIGPYDLDAGIAELKKFYTGPLTVGADLQCTQVQ